MKNLIKPAKMKSLVPLFALMVVCFFGYSGTSMTGNQLNIYIIRDGLDAYDGVQRNVTVTPYIDSNYQKWIVEADLSKSFKLKNVGNGLYLTYGGGCTAYENLVVDNFTGLSTQGFHWNDDMSISPLCDAHLILGTLRTTPPKAALVSRRINSRKLNVK